MRHEIAQIDWMAHEAIEPGRDDAAVGRHETEATAERELAPDDDEQPDGRRRRGDRVGHQSGPRRGHHERWADNRQRRQDARAQASIDRRGAAPHDGQDDDEQLAHEEQEAREPAGLEVVRADAQGEQREERDGHGAGREVGPRGPRNRHGMPTECPRNTHGMPTECPRNDRKEAPVHRTAPSRTWASFSALAGPPAPRQARSSPPCASASSMK